MLHSKYFLLTCLQAYWAPFSTNLPLNPSINFLISDIRIFSSRISIWLFYTDSSSVMKFSILPSIILNVLVTIIFKPIPNHSNIWVICLLLWSIYFSILFSAYVIIFIECQILCLKFFWFFGWCQVLSERVQPLFWRAGRDRWSQFNQRLNWFETKLHGWKSWSTSDWPPPGESILLQQCHLRAWSACNGHLFISKLDIPCFYFLASHNHQKLRSAFQLLSAQLFSLLPYEA